MNINHNTTSPISTRTRQRGTSHPCTSIPRSRSGLECTATNHNPNSSARDQHTGTVPRLRGGLGLLWEVVA